MWEFIFFGLAFVGALCIACAVILAVGLYVAERSQTGHHCPQCGRAWESDR